MALCRSHPTPFPSASTPWGLYTVVWIQGSPTHFQDLLSLPFLLISTPLCQLRVCRNTFYQGPPSARWAEMHNSFSEPTSEKFLAVAGNWHRVPQLNNAQGVGDSSILSPKRDASSNASRPGSGIHGEEEAHRSQQRQWQHTKDLTRFKTDGVPALCVDPETQDHAPNQESICN